MFDLALSKLNAVITQIEPHLPPPPPEQVKPQKKKNPLPQHVQDLQKCDMRVVQIIDCKTLDFSKEQLYVTVQISPTETRCFAAGMGLYYTCEQLIGRKIITILNIQPISIGGRFKSDTMLFAGVSEDESVVKVVMPDQSVPVGTRVVIEKHEEVVPVEGICKNPFKRLVAGLKVKNNFMALQGEYLLAGGKRIDIEMPDDTIIY